MSVLPSRMQQQGCTSHTKGLYSDQPCVRCRVKNCKQPPRHYRHHHTPPHGLPLSTRQQEKLSTSSRKSRRIQGLWMESAPPPGFGSSLLKIRTTSTDIPQWGQTGQSMPGTELSWISTFFQKTLSWAGLLDIAMTKESRTVSRSSCPLHLLAWN